MSSGHDVGLPVTTLVFAVGGLKQGAGGIAELSRQVLTTLLELHSESRLQLEVHVLDEAGPEKDDDLCIENSTRMHWYAGSRWRFTAGLLRAHADLYLYDHVGLARLQGLLPWVFRAPYLLLIHSVEIWNNQRSDYHRTARGARLLIANSQYTARKARSHYPDLPEITVCWPGKETFETASGDEALPVNTGPHAMLIVGRLDAAQRHKGHDHLIEAMPAIVAAVPDAQLVIAGGGDDRDRLQQKAVALGVAEHVLFTGWLAPECLRALYRQCALFVMPSQGDGFGLVFLEAMMHGLPCVGLQQGAAEEIFEGGRSGVLVDREDRQGMANVLSGLLLDEEQRRQMGKAGYDRYREQFTAAKHAARFREIIVRQAGL